MSQKKIKIGTRGSKLALYQAKRVEDDLNSVFSDLETEIVIINTKGDKILDVALSKIGDKGLFTKELELALLDGSIDLAVHSLKDMPTELPSGLKLGAVLERGEINDAFVSRDGRILKDFTQKDTIATSSLRRIASLRHMNSNFNIVDIRGNVQTRLQKMKDGYCDAMIMAATGLRRLGLEKHITEIIPPEVMIPAVGQGAIGIEIKEQDSGIESIIKKINHMQTWQAIIAEREYMHRLQGGCQVPVGCFSKVEGENITLKGFVSSLDAKQYITDIISGPVSESTDLGRKLAEKIIEKGGEDILNEIRKDL